LGKENRFAVALFVWEDKGGVVSVPGAIATGSGGTIENQRDFLIRSLSLPVLTPRGALSQVCGYLFCFYEVCLKSYGYRFSAGARLELGQDGRDMMIDSLC
jgi:hypothetical protein